MKHRSVKRLNVFIVGAVALICLIILLSCAAFGPIVSVQPMCVERSVYAALAFRMQTGAEVRVVISNVSPGLDHAQAQAKLNDRWLWLNQSGDEVYVGGVDFKKARPYKYLTLRELMAELEGKGFL